MNDGPIGVFDSGLGGISVLNECLKLVPDENYIYYADKVNAPYGEKTDGEITLFLEKVIEDFFIPKGVKTIVLACNTATNASIDYLRKKYIIPIIGTEPAIKPAISSLGQDKKALILATESTVKSKRFKEKLELYDCSKYIVMGCGGLVEWIEENNEKEVNNYFENKFKLIDTENINSIVLGCTHYPFIKNSIKETLNKNIDFFDGGRGVAKRLKNILEENNLRTLSKKIENVEVFNSLNSSYNENLIKYIGR